MDPPLERNLGKLADSVQALLSVGVEDQPSITETVATAPVKKRWPISIWATILLILAAVVIVGGVGGWAITWINSTTPSPTSTAVSVVAVPSDTLDVDPSPSPDLSPFTESPPTPEDQFRVGFVTDTSEIDDKSFNSTIWNGILRAQEELGIKAQF